MKKVRRNEELGLARTSSAGEGRHKRWGWRGKNGPDQAEPYAEASKCPVVQGKGADTVRS